MALSWEGAAGGTLCRRIIWRLEEQAVISTVPAWSSVFNPSCITLFLSKNEKNSTKYVPRFNYVTKVHMGHTHALLVFNAWRMYRWQMRTFRGLISMPFIQEGPFQTGPFKKQAEQLHP